MVVFIGLVLVFSIIWGVISGTLMEKECKAKAKAQMEYYKKYYGDDDE